MGYRVTIREHFLRTYNRIKWAVVGVIVLMVGLLMWLHPYLTRPQGEAASAVMGLALGGVLVLVFRGQFACPRCGADLAKLRNEEAQRQGQGNVRKLIWNQWDACPKCGVSFDEQWGPIG